jgi:hypothetical protein
MDGSVGCSSESKVGLEKVIVFEWRKKGSVGKNKTSALAIRKRASLKYIVEIEQPWYVIVARGV